jgi:hypothetical protein
LEKIQDPEERSKAAKAARASSQTELYNARQNLDKAQGSAFNYIYGDEIKNAQDNYEKAVKHHELNIAATGELVNGRRQEFKGPSREALQAQKLQGLMAHYPKEMQPQFTGIEQARKMMQVNALKDPLEQEVLRLQREAYKKFLDEVPQIMGDIAKNTKDGGGLL